MKAGVTSSRRLGFHKDVGMNLLASATDLIAAITSSWPPTC